MKSWDYHTSIHVDVDGVVSYRELDTWAMAGWDRILSRNQARLAIAKVKAGLASRPRIQPMTVNPAKDVGDRCMWHKLHPGQRCRRAPSDKQVGTYKLCDVHYGQEVRNH